MPATRSIKVEMGKGGKDRIAFYGARTARVLNRWSAVSGATHREDLLFATSSGRPLGRTRVDRDLRRLAKCAGVTPISCHQLRHFCATEMLRHGADIEAVRQLLGHTSLRMTLRYLHMLGADLARAHRRASPGDWLDREGV